MNHAMMASMALLLVGCGPTTMMDFCEELAARTCKQTFQCVVSSAQSLYADEAACTQDLIAKAKCDRLADYPCDLDRAKANTCLRSIDQAECRVGAPSAETLAPCQDPGLCVLRPGVIRCSSTSTEGGGSGCSTTKSRCSDGKTYAIVCTSAGECSCTTDGVKGTTFTDTTFCNGPDQSERFRTKCALQLY